MTTLPDTAYFNLTDDLKICRVLTGLWQVSGAHGKINSRQAIDEMLAYHDAGFTTWDLADHYGPAEDFIGVFRQKLRERDGANALSLAQTQAFTKWVPAPQRITYDGVVEAINTSLRRMNTPTLDMVQFHWWEYRFPGYIDALKHMMTLRDQGAIRYLALTNFDSERVHEINNAGITIITNQVQYSLIDQRPIVRMTDACEKYNMWLLTYGTLCGGLISEKYLRQPEPQQYQLETASLRKYKNMIDTWGGWTLFQELLHAIKALADKYQVSMANVATRYILDKPRVAGVILGARLGIAEHRAENANIFSFKLEPSDIETIHKITSKSRNLFRIIGDCGAEYRR